MTDGLTVASINNSFVDRFIAFRKREGVGGHTISRDLAALRGSLYHAERTERIARGTAPFVREVDQRDKAGPREKILTMEQVAGLLEAAARSDERRHVLLYTLIQLSTLGRTDAILELEAGQIDRGLIQFLRPGADLTRKRRTTVPVAPTLAPWVADVKGKVITYRVPIAARRWADPNVPEWFEKPCSDIGKAFAGCLIDAGECGVEGVSVQARDDRGDPLWLPPRGKLRETAARPAMVALATPNTLRHTALTEMHTRGVPEAQIDMAAGHLGEGTGKRNYRHLRPDYLADLIDGVEGYWNDMRRLTTVHLLRSSDGPVVVDFAGRRRTRR